MATQGFNKFRDASSKMPPPSKGKFDKEPWALQNFAMEAGEVALTRVLEPPSNGFYSRTLHFWNRPGTCTCDIPVFGDKCVYCFMHQKGSEEAKKAGNGPDGKPQKNKYDKLWKRMAYVLEVIDFRYFHKGMDPEDSEKPILIPCGNTEAMPKRNRCGLCQKGDLRIFGGRKNWECSLPQFRSLVKIDAQIGENCITPIENKVCGRKINLIGFACGGEGHELMGEDGILQMPAEKLNEYVTTKVACPACAWEGLPVDVLVADDDCPACGGCAPVRATMFHKNIEVSCIGAPDGRGGTKKTYNYDKSQPFTLIEDDLLAHLEEKDVVEMLSPRDLSYTFRPEWINREKFDSDEAYVMAVLDKQAEQLKVPNPYKPGGGSAQQTVAYQGGGFRRR